MVVRMSDPPHTRVAIVGAGFGGLAVAQRLRAGGEEDLVVLERADRPGGVWRDTTYPGAQCDVPSHLYSLSWAPNPGWTRAFSPGPEIQAYLERVAAEVLAPHMAAYGEELLGADWDEGAARWRITTSRGARTADVLVAAPGPLTEPRLPDVPGMADFAGAVIHSTRWDHGHDFAGERVVVVGTGASAVQIVPRLREQAAHTTILQRTPGWVLPRADREIGPLERAVLRACPPLTRLYRLKQWALRDGLVYPMIRRRRRIRRLQERQARRYLAHKIADPLLRARLTPDYEIGCKRVLISSEYLPALTQPDVTLVPHALAAVRGDRVVAADGSEHRADAIVLATGYHVLDPPILERVRGRGGRSVADTWRGRPRYHRGGATLAGFPNLFMIAGAGTGSGHGSMVWAIEAQAAYVADALRTMREQGLAVIEPSAAAQDAEMDAVGRRLDRTVWARGGCRSWYLDAERRPTTMWPGTMLGFRRLLRRFDVEHFDVRPAPTA
jgi:cation diffusion facilitator CzcD-associated flavoprotein CzcO